MKNPNTAKFWNRLIENNQEVLIDSPIYLAKCDYVLSSLNNEHGRVLDVGVGYGHVENQIIKNKLDLELFGIDIAKSSIDKFNKTHKNNFKIGEVGKIPFKNDFFDAVLLLDVLEHIPQRDSKRSLGEVYRVLKKRGIFIISVPLNDGPKDRILNGHLRRYSPESIAREVTDAGFVIEKRNVFYAYSKFFKIKNFLVKLFPVLNNKPNLIILVAQKI